jgi:hypothetical protein
VGPITDSTQGFALARQILYPISLALSPFVYILFLRQGLTSFS